MVLMRMGDQQRPLFPAAHQKHGGGRSEITDFEEVVMLDRQYIQNWSPMLDIKILASTVKTVLKRDGAS